MPSVATPERVDAALEIGLTGRDISGEEAILLMENASFFFFFQAEYGIRDRGKGPSVSFSKKVFIPLTYLCRDYCGYCTFRADPQPGVRPSLLPDEVPQIGEAGGRAGCKEAFFSLGGQPETVFPEA